MILNFIDHTASDINAKVQQIKEIRFDSQRLDAFFINLLMSEPIK